MPIMDLIGKTLVITAGIPVESIDGIRHYANHKRLESHGFAVAQKLQKRGARVIVITPKNSLAAPEGCEIVNALNGKSIVSGEDVMTAAEETVKKHAPAAALCLASLSSLKPATVFAHKIKAKNQPGKPVALDVIGNIDVKKRTRPWNIPVIGYDSWQTLFMTANLPGWLATLDIADQGEKNWPTSVEPGTDWPALFESKKFPEWLASAPKHDKFNEPSAILSSDIKAETSLSPRFFDNLKGKTVVMTSGPTEELLTKSGDVITNFSSGQQGYEIACILAAAGAKVKYVVGRTNFPAPKHENVETTRVTSAKSMLAAAESKLPADIYIGVAAVADFCRKGLGNPLAENEAESINLDQNSDILAAMGTRAENRPSFVIGFAAENDPSKLIAYATDKLAKKKADLICANPVGEQSNLPKGTNQITFITTADNPRRLPPLPKSQAALAIVAKIAALSEASAKTP
ncbi:MAG: phosphopantothenoylcysteine decarboxylase [Alphaproteobacteria bacterium]|nr:phosphopantothenoylcysteine decarboxylase [Alphaproteobacteria bacterium]